MKKHHLIILIVSIATTSLLFLHDYLYDAPGQPYLIKDIIADIVFAGSMYTSIFFGTIFGVYSLAKFLFSKFSN